jgi:hypothetical protein
MFLKSVEILREQAFMSPRQIAQYSMAAEIREQEFLSHKYLVCNRNSTVHHEFAHSLIAYQEPHHFIELVQLNGLLSYLYLTTEKITEFLLRIFKILKVTDRTRAESSRILLRIFLKKQRKVKDKVKSLFIPLKMLLDSLRPIKIPA